MVPHSSTLAWKIPWVEESGRLQSMGSWRVGHDWVTSLSLFTFNIGEGNDNPLQCSCLENPMDRGAWWTAVYGVAQSRTRLKQLSSSSSSSSSSSTSSSDHFEFNYFCFPLLSLLSLWEQISILDISIISSFPLCFSGFSFFLSFSMHDFMNSLCSSLSSLVLCLIYHWALFKVLDSLFYL